MPSDRATSMFWARSSMKRQSPGVQPEPGQGPLEVLGVRLHDTL